MSLRRLRVLTLNFWGVEGDLPRRLALATTQLRALDPDIVMLQEVRPLADRPVHGGASPDAQAFAGAVGTTAEALAAALGLHATYRPAMTWAAAAFAPGSQAGQEGLAILTRQPPTEVQVTALPDARPTEARILLSVRLADAQAWAHTTHLHYRLTDGEARARQVYAIDQAIRALGRGPSDPVHLLGGDFNCTADSDELRFLRGLTSIDGARTHYQDAWLVRRPEPARQDGAIGLTWTARNPLTQPLAWLELERRIDFVWVSSQQRDGAGTVLACDVACEQVDTDGGSRTCASDHFAVWADVQLRG